MHMANARKGLCDMRKNRGIPGKTTRMAYRRRTIAFSFKFQTLISVRIIRDFLISE